MTRRPPPRPLPLGVWLAGAGAVATLLAVSARYGFHRDELYFVVAGRRLDWGFVDQPPLTPLVARVSELVLGASPTALRVVPALCVGSIAVLTGSMARSMGGGRIAQVAAAVAAGWSGVVLGEGHLLSTAIIDFALWTAALWLMVQLLDGADPRWWLALGLVVGVGLQNKHTMAFLAVGLLVGVVATRRSLLAEPMAWLGVGIAALVALPNLLWQAANDWPQLEMAEALRARSDGAVAFVLLQPALLSITLAIPAAIGWWRLLRDGRYEPWRPIAIAYAVLFGVFLMSGGKAYYLAPVSTVLLAAGARWFEKLGRRGRWSMTIAGVAGICVGILIALPVLPASSAGAFDATGELVETIGWEELIEQVEAVYAGIPDDLRADTVIFTSSYGEAGAVDVLGTATGLPPAHSGHNNYWLWGPPVDHGPVIGIGPIGDVLERICPGVEMVGAISNRHGIENEELGRPVLLCLDPRGSLADVWDDAKNYN